MSSKRQLSKLALGIALTLVIGIAAVKPSFATIGTINKADLSGPWQMALSGNTGCGKVSMLVKVTLGGAGLGTNGVITTHGDCGDTILTGQTFQISTLAANGSGTAGLSCGPGCGWNFTIQVSPDRSIFNLVDVDPANPGNYLSGTAIHQ